jgi:GNAT superfamily N-acetyltransferase
MTYRFSNDIAEIDHSLVHHWLSTEAYWALGRDPEVHATAMAGSRNYGVFAEDGKQVAYARIITDGATFAWLCDVFVDPSVRGDGVGVLLVGSIVAELEPLNLRRTMLVTADAHGLYEKFGFDVPANMDWLMALKS